MYESGGLSDIMIMNMTGGLSDTAFTEEKNSYHLVIARCTQRGYKAIPVAIL